MNYLNVHTFGKAKKLWKLVVKLECHPQILLQHHYFRPKCGCTGYFTAFSASELTEQNQSIKKRQLGNSNLFLFRVYSLGLNISYLFNCDMKNFCSLKGLSIICEQNSTKFLIRFWNQCINSRALPHRDHSILNIKSYYIGN